MKTKIIALLIVGILVAAGIGAFAFLMMGDEDQPDVEVTGVSLQIFGNADGDSDVDGDDAQLVQDYLKVVEEGDDAGIEKFVNETDFNLQFADANDDGEIEETDVQQIQYIVEDEAEYVWLLDGLGNSRKIGTDISRIAAEYYANTELCLIMGLVDKLVAIDNAPYIYRDFYFNESKADSMVNLVNMNKPDYVFVNEQDLDILLVFFTTDYEVKQEKIIGTDVLYLGLYNPDMSNARQSNFIQGILKAGYIFGAVERAEAYANWVLETRDDLAAVAASIPEDEKPEVLMSTYSSSYFLDPDVKTCTVYCYTDPLGQACLLGGGKNIGEELYGDVYNTSLSQKSQVDALFNDDNTSTIDYIFLHMVKYTYGGSINAGVPEHGYIATSDDEIAQAWQDTTSDEHTLLVDMDPNNITLIAGDFRNGPTGAVLLGAYIGNMINPEYYSEIDAIALHNHYINFWLGIADYDVAVDGVFMYQPYE